MSQTKATDVPASSKGSNPRPIPGYSRFRKVPDFGNAATNCFDLENYIKALAVPVVGEKEDTIPAQPVFIVDPCQGGLSPVKTATVVPSAVAGTALSGTGLIGVFRGGYYQQPASQGQYLEDLSIELITQTSSANASQQVIIDLRNLASILDIIMDASGGGTATVTISVSIDNSTYKQIDSIAAAALTVKHYNNTVVGASTYAVCPLAFRYVKIVVGTAGVGNTTTLIIGIK